MSEAKPLAPRELWFVAGSQELYGEEVLALVDAQSREVAGALDEAPALPVSVVHRGVVKGSEEVRRVCLAANADENCAGVIVWMHTFSPAKMWIAGLGALQKPLLHLHTQFNAGLPWSTIDMDFMNLNQSAHGDREFAHIVARMRLRHRTVVGHWRESATLDRIATWSRAACGWHEAQRLKVARFGDNMRQVAVTDGDKVEAQVRFGFTVDGHGVGDLADALEAAATADVERVVGEYEHAYELAPELQRDGARREALVYAARIEVALRSFLGERGYHAFTDTFEDLHGLRQLPGLAVQRLMADGYGFGAEGDWKTAALVRILKVMAAGLPGGTSFMEDYTYDLTPGSPKVLGSHMLEICPSIAAARPSCEIHPLSIGGREDPVRLVFTASSGPAVLLAMLDLGDRFRLVANEVDVIAPEEDLPRLPVARAVWTPRPDFETATEAWLEAGGPHHSVLTAALGVEALVDLAEIAGVELVVIDNDTHSRAFRNELRWNAAHYRLAAN
ncbi:MAG TPA: L-arabinose isomerase [Solirubrobacteraceae bacterium]|nr:L-arabinose isomerase [Solirubrobacteraceae bacterium]